jgi:hypothetical protein
MSESSSPASSVSFESSSSAGWVVTDILAERSSLSGEDEVLVVWKPEWVPFSTVREGPVRDAWMLAPKWSASQTVGGMVMRISLPIESNSSLATDVNIMASCGQRKRALAPQ